MLYLVLEDFAAGSFSASAGSLLDDSTIDLAPLQNAGLAVVAYSPATMAAARSAFLAARGSKPTTPDASGDLTALLLAAGAIGDGGITELTGDVLAGPGSGSQASTVVALQGSAVSATPPFADGQVLRWNGTEWVPASVPAGGSGGGGQVYFLNNGLAGDAPLPAAGTKELGTVAEVPLTTVTSATLPSDGTTFALVAGFVTDLGSPGLTAIPTGLWDFNVWTRAVGPSLQPNAVRFRLSVCVWDGVAATLIATSGVVPLYDPSQVVQYGCSALVPQTPLLATDRIYVTVEATATSNNHQIAVSFGDAAPTHVHTTLPSISGTGLVHVINGVIQSPASPVDLAAGATEITGTLPIGNGGTGLSTTPTDGQLLIGDTATSAYVQAGLTAGTGIAVTPGAGSITVANTGVTSVGATAPITSSGGATPTIGLGTVGVANGGTGLTTAPSNGQLLIGNGTGYTQAGLTAGSGITITTGAGSTNIAASGGGGGGDLVNAPLNASTNLSSDLTMGGFYGAGLTTTTISVLIYSANSTVARVRIKSQAGAVLAELADSIATFGWRTLSLATPVVLPSAFVFTTLAHVSGSGSSFVHAIRVA